MSSKLVQTPCYRQYRREKLIQVNYNCGDEIARFEHDIFVSISIEFTRVNFKQPKYVIFHSIDNNEISSVTICRPDLSPEEIIDYEFKKLSIESSLNEQAENNGYSFKFKIL